jgi:hypothetical protein
MKNRNIILNHFDKSGVPFPPTAKTRLGFENGTPILYHFMKNDVSILKSKNENHKNPLS